MIVRTWRCARGHELQLEDSREHPEIVAEIRKRFAEGGCTAMVGDRVCALSEVARRRCGEPMTEVRS